MEDLLFSVLLCRDVVFNSRVNARVRPASRMPRGRLLPNDGQIVVLTGSCAIAEILGDQFRERLIAQRLHDRLLEGVDSRREVLVQLEEGLNTLFERSRLPRWHS